ncbi:hypothetical protein FA13DRAFT_1828354 [Coprinellus micaceus]|uniref:Uncharacterized protein n=1 Tax=Coprinellus micaceus TaxID=71717 RepID=A0A4Y7TJG9_COPMI|nr:hypothetical protein FA13DRAFT_1828354 [Coprinellus micaceus]
MFTGYFGLLPSSRTSLARFSRLLVLLEIVPLHHHRKTHVRPPHSSMLRAEFQSSNYDTQTPQLIYPFAIVYSGPPWTHKSPSSPITIFSESPAPAERADRKALHNQAKERLVTMADRQGLMGRSGDRSWAQQAQGKEHFRRCGVFTVMPVSRIPVERWPSAKPMLYNTSGAACFESLEFQKFCQVAQELDNA